MQRNTIQSALVLEAVQQLHCHPTADEIYEAISVKHPTLARATVYRNLQRLAEDGRILKVQIPDGADRYDCTNHRHYHVKCIKCGKVYDVNKAYMVGLEKSITDAKGFRYLEHEIIFKGICPSCN